MKTPSHGLKLGGGGGGGGRKSATRALTALTLIAAIAALILYVYSAALPAAAQTTTDYDDDGDNLIEITTLDQLNAVRWDLNGNGVPDAAANTTTYAAAFPGGNIADTSTPYMGCAAACEGYELMANLDFAADNMAVTSTDAYPNWAPIGGDYAAVFDGNGHTITRLTINRSSGNLGLFSALAANGVIRNVGMIAPNVSGGGTHIGVLAGFIRDGGEITASYVQGGAVVALLGNSGGGLIGSNFGTIRASFATASVSGGTSSNVGGLVGYSRDSTIIASYAAGATAVGSGGNAGGLLGWAVDVNDVFTDSYCDTESTGQSDCIGLRHASSTVTVAGYTTAELRTPIGYTGIFANWNVDVDGDAIPDNPWNFGTTTTRPILNTPAQRIVDHDSDNDGLIEIDTLQKLNAIRHDLGGDGLPDATTTYAAYVSAFIGGDLTAATATRMGCVSGCAGYELTEDLDFSADGVAVTSTDPYPNWTPIGGSYAAIFDGNGHTISRLTITGGGRAGLFTTLASGGVIRDVGMIAPSVRTSGVYTGTLAAVMNSGSEIRASYVQGGSVVNTAPGFMGGLTGSNNGAILASYSSASVDAGGAGSSIGGLVGNMTNGTIIASYAIGAVTGTGAVAIGGFVGRVTGAGSAITDSYCDTGAAGQANCIGSQTGGAAVAAAGHSSTTLQTPVGYTGIYANWNLDLDGDTFPDYLWNFGATTTYPTLYKPTERQTAAALVVDYDQDNDNLIDITNPQQLNALRYDPDGNGLPDNAAHYSAYTGGFPNGNISDTSTPYLGCQSTCIGYELTQSLDFAAGPYPNWTPIGGSYAAVFDGKGLTIRNLTIAGTTGNSGLFDTLGSGGVIRDLGMLAASIGNDGADAYVGVLAGDNDGGMIITSYASGGAVTVTGTSTYAGGLIGRNAGDVRAVYSTASVTASSTATTTIGGLIGLHAGSISASYAAGTTTGSGAAIVGGFAGAASSTAAAITNGYCDTTVNGTSTPCVAAHTAGATATSTGYTTTQLQTPTGYTGIYESWNIPLGTDNMLDDPWNFGTSSQYPTIKPVASRTRTAPPAPPLPTPPPTTTPEPTPTPTSTPATSTDPVPGNGGNGNGGSATSTDTLPPAPTPPPTPAPTPDPTDSGNGETGTSTDTLPPPLPRTIPPEPDTPYNPAADHPEIYNNAEYEMAATCQTHNEDEDGNPQAATVTFDLGTYTGPILLHLSIWANGRYMAYETQGLASPTLERDGQRATLRVDTDPAQTRFRLDGRRHGLAANLLLGYANCDTDDP